MSYKQMTGNIISATKVEPAGILINSAASGVWSLQEQYDYVKGGNWPNRANLPRGLFFGGNTGSDSNVIDYITIATTGNATDFGDIIDAAYFLSGTGSSTRGVMTGGDSDSRANKLSYVTIASTGDAADFGNLSGTRWITSTVGSNTRAVFMGGYDGEPTSNTIGYVTIASLGNETDFGDLTQQVWKCAGSSSPTRGLRIAGNTASGANSTGEDNTAVDVVDYITIASAGNATDFGDTSSARHQLSSASSNTRALTFGGANTSGTVQNIVEYFTIDTTGNATDFGDLSTASELGASVSNNIRACHALGYTSGIVNTIDYFTIASTGNATDFGNLSVTRYNMGGLSNGHGGLA
tara:strand:+ start:2532 stop:3587 length:1056 start_codon:yes stop_codon:yes gene_type:complete